MKRAKKQFGRKNLRNMFGVFLVICLLAAAFLLPELYFSYNDKTNQNQVEYLDARMDTYQIQYDDFKKKLEALGEYEGKGTKLQAALLQETTDLDTQIRLTDAVNREFDQMALRVKIWMDMEKICYITDLKSCGLYTAYPKDGGEEQFKGFVFWKIVYESEDGYGISVLLDAEFEKIISYGIWNKDIQAAYEEYRKAESKPNAAGLWNIYEGETPYGFVKDTEFLYIWGDEMLFYYDMYDVIAGIEYGIGSYYGQNSSSLYISMVKEAKDAAEALSGWCIFEFEEELSYLRLEYCLKEEQERIYFITGLSCFNDFLQL